MAQSQPAPQVTRRAHPGFSSPPGLHVEESESRRPPRLPLPGTISNFQAPQVVTIDIFFDYQRQVASTFERQSRENAALQERCQALEERIISLEEAENKAIDAVCEIRDDVVPRVKQHHQSIEGLLSAVNRQNTIIEALGSFSHEFRAGQSRDGMRPGQPAWRPGPLGGPADHMKGALEEIKGQLTRSSARLNEHDAHLAESDTRLGTHERHLTEHERKFAAHEARLASYERHMAEQNAKLASHFRELEGHQGAFERVLRENDKRIAEHAECLGALDKTNNLWNSRISLLEQRAENRGSQLSPAQVTAIVQSHQQRLDSLEQTLKTHMNSSRESHAAKPISPQSRPLSASGVEPILETLMNSQGGNQPNRLREADRTDGISEPPFKKVRREEGEADLGADIKRLGKHMDAIDKRFAPLEERLSSIEKDLEKITQAAVTPESADEDQILEKGQFEILKQTDFQSAEDLAALRSNEDSTLLMQLYSAQDKCEDTCYTVQRADDWFGYPTMLELERNAFMPEGKYLPRYVYEVGEIFNRKASSKQDGRQSTHRSTGYHLVVDVTKPEKSLWLVYRYEEESDDRKSLKQSITYKHDSFWHPFASVGEYDIAMVFERFEDWKGSDTPVGSYATSRKLVRQTRCLIRPTFIEPVLNELKAEIRQGWEASSKAGTKMRR
ncbi:hypothetical protein F5Y17DRAFT_280382 [Xylariaceae sp. FL0594]|nr:hypothetical protein F5Y17DRAFT_280382 [Xylariaceae sp. FL0594]